MRSDLIFEFRYALRHPRVRLALFSMFAAGALLLLAMLALWLPARHATQSLTGDIDHLRQINHDNRYSAELAVAVKNATARVGEAEKKLNQQAVQTLLVQHLGQHAARHGVRILSSNYDEGTVQGGFQPIYHELAVQGSYAGVRGFLADIPELPTLTVIEECTIARLREGSVLKATLQMRTWRRSGGA